MQNKNLNLVILMGALILMAVVSRFVSHAWNFTIVGGLAIFCGAFFTKKWMSFVVLFSSLLISDAFIGFHNQMPAVYISFLTMLVLGSILTINSSRVSVLATTVFGSFLFFVITNFFVWFGGSMYAQTFDGLIQCYVMGVPFYQNQIVADILTTFALFEVAKACRSFLETRFDQQLVKVTRD